MQYANGLFICAAVACNFIKNGHDPDSQMKRVLDPSRPQQLTALDGLAAGRRNDIGSEDTIEMDALLG